VSALTLQELAVFDQYVLGMLANFDSMPLDRIHNMLKMFVQDPHPYDKTQDQLSEELSRLVGDGKLLANGNMYRIVRSD
jgi:anaphase-promoting complex subunit 2